MEVFKNFTYFGLFKPHNNLYGRGDEGHEFVEVQQSVKGQNWVKNFLVFQRSPAEFRNKLYTELSEGKNRLS